MYCVNCGSAVEDNARFCPECGSAVGNAAAAPAKKGGNKAIIIIVAIVAAIAVIGGIIGGVLFIAERRGMEELSRKLTTIDWSRVEQGESGSLYTLRLDFDGDDIVYDFDSFYLYENITVMDYEVIASDKIRVDGNRVIEIEFSDDMFVMTMRPALTSVDNVEYWYDHDD